MRAGVGLGIKKNPTTLSSDGIFGLVFNYAGMMDSSPVNPNARSYCTEPFSTNV